MSVSLLKEEKEYSFEEAKEMILEMSSIYGEEYQSIIKQIFDKRWIDLYSNQYKKEGWYKNGSYLTHPVVFANYHSKYIDVSSLAHELGHAAHHIYAQKNNPYFLYEESLFIAEVASLTNEMVLAKSRLNKITDKNEKLEILDTMISTFSSNFFDGAKGSEFEKEAHQLVEEEKPITPDILNQLWEDISKKYTGGIIEHPNRYVWTKIPHFFIDFYYYKYATGAACAMYLSDKILYGTEEDKENYLAFLKTGGSLDPIDALKIAGVDMTKKEVYEKAIESYDQLLEEYMKIYHS